ncbi:MAG: UDP-3-O-[3-hydroxymyristoyl] N-acetylglucosamine deacetylase [Chlamydiae bacterium]|nr:MAG: UDP-3-O-[3-hydroxymyristoyl] N-acetylglucosamine deacetylase [Chlamydiota bacterium]
MNSAVKKNNMYKQATIGNTVKLSGIGLHSGELTTLKFIPAEENTGVIFRRVDLPGKPEIPAHVSSVINTQRSTTIGTGSAYIQTVEHILATLQCLEIDNIIIEVDAPETPLTDGSGKQFIETINSAGRVVQDAESEFIEITEPIAIDSDEMTLCALPADRYKISYTMAYKHPVVGTQFHSFAINSDTFINEIGPARTFATYNELEQLLKNGLIKGGSLDNAIIVTDQAILSKEGLRYKDEFVRHKIMDIIGDLSLIGGRIRAHIISLRSGHTYNIKLARAINNFITK